MSDTPLPFCQEASPAEEAMPAAIVRMSSALASTLLLRGFQGCAMLRGLECNPVLDPGSRSALPAHTLPLVTARAFCEKTHTNTNTPPPASQHS
ncbi:hypothetical protein KOW79_004515 [Hemibagrus wyckioides]|uniref:Uncharacterized protein n=1 Tax=Hemibagrus wyckioides TaxID=337641 RepID=A0A9D3P113_9TELE|nr:hypothetical protein KOW79_004515 [Hemibagrus wyckioides]